MGKKIHTKFIGRMKRRESGHVTPELLQFMFIKSRHRTS